MSKRNRNKKNSSVKGTVMQSVQPRPIQISLYQNQIGTEMLNAMMALMKQNGPDSSQLTERTREISSRYEKILQKQMTVIASVCTGLWRIQQNYSQIPTEEMPDKVRRSNRHLESIMDTLTQSGFTIKDHVREPYDPGMFLNVVAYEPTDGLRREIVIETIKPSVYWEDKCIQSGEVIVGTPKNLDNAG